MPLNNTPILSAEALLAATDAVKVLIAPVTGKRIRLVDFQWLINTTAAQVIEVKESVTGTVLLTLGASLPVGNNGSFILEKELVLDNGLNVDPVAAGPAGQFVARYQIV